MSPHAFFWNFANGIQNVYVVATVFHVKFKNNIRNMVPAKMCFLTQVRDC